MNDKILNKRMRENYEHILRKMSDTERAWAEDFERLEYAIERGHEKEAVQTAKHLNPDVAAATLLKIRDEIDIKVRCNPVRVEAEKRKPSRYQAKGERSVKADEYYDASDWVKQKFGFDHQTGESFELVTATNPEDALIQALDAARAHGVSLDEFVNNPKYHTAERKAGRPKKIKE